MRISRKERTITPSVHCDKPGTVLYAKIRVVHRDKKYARGFSKRLQEFRTILTTIVRWEDDNFLVVKTAGKRSKEHRVHRCYCCLAN